MKYEYLDHTADAKFKAYGKNLEEAFRHAAQAYTGVLINPEQVKKTSRHEIKVTARRLRTLLYEFLEEELFLMDTEGLLTSDAEDVIIIENDDGYTLTAVLVGDHYSNYTISGDIKSITYNAMDIEQRDDGVVLTVVVDI